MDATFEGRSTVGHALSTRIADREDPAHGNLQVSDVMTPRAVSVPRWISAAAARKVAALKAVDHLLVEEAGRPVGIVSGIDLNAASADETVGTLSRSLAASVRPTTPLARARDLMLKNRVSCLPVFAGAWLLGLVTRDAVERALRTREHRVAPEAAAAPAAVPASAAV